jgi:hypothetical protein
MEAQFAHILVTNGRGSAQPLQVRGNGNFRMCPEFRSRIPLRSLRNSFANFAVMGLSLQTVAKTKVFNRKSSQGKSAKNAKC